MGELSSNELKPLPKVKEGRKQVVGLLVEAVSKSNPRVTVAGKLHSG